jgi:hypothetical protein
MPLAMPAEGLDQAVPLPTVPAIAPAMVPESRIETNRSEEPWGPFQEPWKSRGNSVLSDAAACEIRRLRAEGTPRRDAESVEAPSSASSGTPPACALPPNLWEE